MEDRINLKDYKEDILSHPSRRNAIHILTLDSILANDVYERIHNDERMKYYQLIKPRETEIHEAVTEIDNMAVDTVFSRLLIIDVRRVTLPKLQRAYNKVVGYNRRDLNKLCHIILIGDGPWDLFHAGKTLDVLIEGLGDIEGTDEKIAVGRTYRDAPEIDGIVLVEVRRRLQGHRNTEVDG